MRETLLHNTVSEFFSIAINFVDKMIKEQHRLIMVFIFKNDAAYCLTMSYCSSKIFF